MRKSRITAKFLDKYFDKNYDLHVLTYNLLTFVGIIGLISVAVITLLLFDSALVAVVDLVLAALMYMFLRIADRKKCYRLCTWLQVILIFMLMFPFIYFRTGGYRGLMPPFFVLAIAFTAFLHFRLDLVVAVSLELLIYIGCSLVDYFRPGFIAPLIYETNNISNSIVGYVMAGLLLLLNIVIRTHIINERQKQVRELNRELKARNETLIRYDLMKSDFLATVAHEINTPLAIITAGSSDTLDLLKESPLNLDEIIENQKLIERRVKHIDSILLDLMDTVALENGRISLSRQPLDLAELLRNICDPMVKRTDLKGNVFEYDIQDDLPQIWADAPRIEQVMVNLLSNSINHTTGGRIVVKLERDVDTQIVSVADTGAGMDEETVRVVLRQYVSTKADYWRHGMGLYICRRIIMAHGGEIWIDSVEGHGTTVSFSLREDPDYE